MAEQSKGDNHAEEGVHLDDVTDNVLSPGEKFDKSKVPGACSQRWYLAYLQCLGLMLVYALRVNFSVAIVCMVKSDVINDSTNGNISESNVTATMMTQPSAGRSECEEFFQSDSVTFDRGELSWNKATRSRLLAMYFYGYIFLQVPGGWVSGRFGGRRVLLAAMFVGAIATLLLPVAARTHEYLVDLLRFILGFSQGVVFPACHSMWGRWAPPLERSKLVSISYSGPMMGNILTFGVSGLLCAYGFDNGWGSIFYITGGLTLIWVVLWKFLTSDYPSVHPRISEVERDYIETSIGYRYTAKRKAESLPWGAMFRSKAVWACVVAHACNNWTNYTMLTGLPTFMKEVLKFDIKQNGLLSAVPYICQTASGIASGQLADFLRERKYISTTACRRLFQFLSFTGMTACLVATGYMTCERSTVAVAMLSLALAFAGLNKAGYIVNHVDFAPKYAGVLFGITNTVATIPGMIAPLVAGALTPNKTQEEWRNVFYTCAALALFGAIVFGTCASGDVQPWALEVTDQEVKDVVSEDNEKEETCLPEEQSLRSKEER